MILILYHTGIKLFHAVPQWYKFHDFSTESHWYKTYLFNTVPQWYKTHDFNTV
jgi:hypothetical protein